MIKNYLKQLVEESQQKVMAMAQRLTDKNSQNRINSETATAGFYMLHIAEAQILLGNMFFGTSHALPDGGPKTMRVPADNGEFHDFEITKKLLEEGFNFLFANIENLPEEKWVEEMETKYFGKLSLIKSLGKILNHNSHHCGQIELCLKKGSKI